jgi:hypothetical protein
MATDKDGKSLGSIPTIKHAGITGVSFKDALHHIKSTNGNISLKIPPTYAVIDLDLRYLQEDKLSEKAQEEFLEEFLLRSGMIRTNYFIVKSGGYGYHIYGRIPKNKFYRQYSDNGSKDETNKIVELKTPLKPITCIGSLHNKTHQLYTIVSGGCPLENIQPFPDLLLQQFERVHKPLVTKSLDGVHQKLTIDTSDLNEYLSHLNPKNFREYDNWFKLLTATHAASGGSGLQEFMEWSTQDQKYSDAMSDIIHSWESITLKENDENKIGVGTFFHILKEHNVPYVVPSLSSLSKEDRKELQERELEEYKKGKYDELIDKLNADMGLIIAEDNASAMVMFRQIMSDGTLVYSEKNLTAITAICKNLNVQVPIQTKDKAGVTHVKASDFWLEHERRKTYAGIVFDPTKEPIEFKSKIEDPDSGEVKELLYFNKWYGLAFEYDKSVKSEIPQELEYFLKDICCNGCTESFEYVLKWMSSALKDFDRPLGVTLVFRGGSGSGKSVFNKFMSKFFHSANVSIDKEGKIIYDQFNPKLMESIYLGVNEFIAVKTKAGLSTLKGKITDKEDQKEAKFGTKVMANNYLRMTFCTNYDNSVHLTPDDRRFFCLEVSMDRANDKPYFDNLEKLFNTKKFMQPFFNYLMDLDVSLDKFNIITDRPKTEEMRYQLYLSSYEKAKLLMDILVKEDNAINCTYKILPKIKGNPTTYLLSKSQIETVVNQRKRDFIKADPDFKMDDIHNYIRSILEPTGFMKDYIVSGSVMADAGYPEFPNDDTEFYFYCIKLPSDYVHITQLFRNIYGDKAMDKLYGYEKGKKIITKLEDL